MVPNFLKSASQHGWLISSLQRLINDNYIVGHLDGNHGSLYPKQEEFTDSGVKYISANAIVGGRVDFAKAKYLSKERADKFKKGVARNGDVIFAHNATVGPVALLETEDAKVILGTSLTYYRVNPDKLDAQYLIQYMSSSAFVRQYESIMRQTTRNQIPITTQKGFFFAIPALQEQKKIARILSSWDKAITSTEQLLANSQQQKKALMQQLLTGKKRLLDENGVWFSGEWELGCLGDLAKISKGKALSSKDLFEGEYPVIAGGKGSPYKHNQFTHENVITVSASGAYAGYVAYHPNKIWASDCSVVVNKSTADIGFIYHLMSFMQKKIYSRQSGGAQPHVYPRDLACLKVKIPELGEQQEISRVLSLTDRGIESIKQKLEALKQEKKALMQQLLTGKRRVKVDDEEAA